MADSPWSWDNLESKLAMGFVGDLLKWLIRLLGPPVMGWLMSKKAGWIARGLRTILYLLVGYTCFFILHDGFSTGLIISLVWWKYVLAVTFLILFLLFDWALGNLINIATSWTCLVCKGSHVNSGSGSKLPELRITWENQGKEEIRLGKPCWEGDKALAYGYLANAPLRYRYDVSRSKTKSEELTVRQGCQVSLLIDLDSCVKPENLTRGKWGTLTLPVTLVDKRQIPITVKL